MSSRLKPRCVSLDDKPRLGQRVYYFEPKRQDRYITAIVDKVFPVQKRMILRRGKKREKLNKVEVKFGSVYMDEAEAKKVVFMHKLKNGNEF